MLDAKPDPHFLVAIADTFPGVANPQDKLVNAFVRQEFILYSQSILRLAPAADKRQHFEIFVRLMEEEQNLIPPGSFLPLLEHLNLGPQLDRYVVQKLLTFYLSVPREEWGIAHLNLCDATFDDQDFCAYVEDELAQQHVDGDFLCFEFPAEESRRPPSALTLARGLQQLGCRISLTTLEDENLSFRPLKEFGANFLKIGGRLIRDLAHDKAAAVEVKTAARACRAFDVHTMAQFVESAPTLDLLRKLDIGYAQGYGISRPGPLEHARNS